MGLYVIRRRKERKGGALASAMLFFVVVTVAGAALLSISMQHRLQIVRHGIDVRLMIAAEAGIESVRGRFTVVPQIQEDWQSLVPGSGWNNVESMNVNGIAVTVEARSIGGPSVPTARVRSTAIAGTRRRTVEYTIKVATFSDYAVFNAGAATSTLGPNYKGVGNMYYGGDVNIPNTGAQIFGNAYLEGEIVQGYGAGNNSDTGQAWTYHFPKDPPAQNQPEIPLPEWASPWDSLREVAEKVGHHWAENTLAIELRGTQYRRYYVRRTSAANSTPSGTDWLNLNSAQTLAPNQRLDFGADSITENGNYILDFEDLDIPDEGVIYVDTGSVQAIDPSSNDADAGTNTWEQSVDWGSNNSGGSLTDGRGSDRDIVRNNGMPGDPYAKVLLVWGVLDDRRVSIACNHKIVLADTIRYQSLIDNPHWRIFHDDGVSGKESAGAKNFHEMLGVMARQDCHMTPTWWRPVPSNTVPGVVAGDIVPGHRPDDAYPLDGVYFSLFDTAPHRWVDDQKAGEFWGHGGLIAGGSYAAGMGNHFAYRQYHWDFRMELTTPPYFLRAYNSSATFIPGTWRTYDTIE